MMDIELCGLGATVVIWYGSGVLSHALGFILDAGSTPTQSVYVRLSVCGSACFVICGHIWRYSCNTLRSSPGPIRNN